MVGIRGYKHANTSMRIQNLHICSILWYIYIYELHQDNDVHEAKKCALRRHFFASLPSTKCFHSLAFPTQSTNPKAEERDNEVYQCERDIWESIVVDNLVQKNNSN